MRRSAAQREAAFTANLVTLIVLLNPSGVNLASLNLSWREQTLLWESQLPGDWNSLWQAMRVTSEEILAVEDGSPVSLWASMPWPTSPDRERWGSYPLFRDLSVPALEWGGDWLREAAFRGDHGMPLVLTHSVAPFWRTIATPIGMINDAVSMGSNLAVLLELLIASREAGGNRHLTIAYLAGLRVFQEVDAGQALIMRLLEDDARRVEPSVVLEVLSEAVQPQNEDTRRYWTGHAVGTARILAICHGRNGDRERIRAVYDLIGGYTRVDPGQMPFDTLLRQEFEILGVGFPDGLFA